MLEFEDVSAQMVNRATTDELEELTYEAGDSWFFLSLQKTVDYLYEKSEVYRQAIDTACSESGSCMHVLHIERLDHAYKGKCSQSGNNDTAL